MSLRIQEITPKFVSGFGGFPRLPERKRWYVCNIGFVGWNCYKLAEEVEQPKFCPTCRVVDVPAYLPEFLDKYMIQSKFNDRVQVKTLEHSMSPGTYCLGRQTPDEQRPESPSERRVPSATYTDERKQPKNPSQ